VFSTSPYIEKLSDNTVYLRLPSFNISQKKSIDSLINANHNLITSTPNLIIDVRNNGGGSDASYDELIQYLYTNPIRYIGVQSYSTKLNNQRFLTYTKNMNFSEEDRKEFFERYKKLNQHLGEFVTDDSVSISILKKIYSYPKNVGILINRGTGSSAEQFLIDAMQSKKVKLFGTSTLGSLDMSNINSVISPNNDFILSYSTTKSLRLPEFVVDASGIQPNYYIDNSIPEEKWIEFVTKILEE
jgi:C-terminal processing protease CtpA/Prc